MVPKPNDPKLLELRAYFLNAGAFMSPKAVDEHRAVRSKLLQLDPLHQDVIVAMFEQRVWPVFVKFAYAPWEGVAVRTRTARGAFAGEFPEGNHPSHLGIYGYLGEAPPAVTLAVQDETNKLVGDAFAAWCRL